MPLEGRLLLGLAFASLVVYLTVPVAIRVADRLQFYDHPVGYKGHARATPYLGGAAVIAGFLLALIAAGHPGRTLPLAGGVALLWAVGTIDDRRTVAWGLRVGIEVALGAALWALDLGWHIGLGGGVDLLLTCAWLVAVINALNLFDNMDGAASTMALVVAAAVAVLGAVQGDVWLGVTGASLAGACLGFLPYNLARPNARIFLGDGGSMPLGFAIAALVMIGTSDALPAWQALIAGLLLVGIPALDTCLVMVSRRRRGLSILTGGRDHLTHRTRRRLRDARAVAAALGGAQATVAALALFSIEGGSIAIVAATLLYLVVAGTAIALLESEEDRLVTTEGQTLTTAPRSEENARRISPAYAVLGVLALGAGLSPFFYGYYDSEVWVPVGLGVITIAGAGALGRTPRVTPAGALVLVGLIGLGVWAIVSSAWAESAQQAVIDGNRWLVIAAVLGAGLVLLRSDRRAAVLTALLALSIVAVATWVLIRMLGGEPEAVFLLGRLDRPLGYINAEGTVFAMGLWLCAAAAELRRPLIAGVGAAGATLCGCLVVLTQSRGAVLAATVAGVAVLALVPGRQRRLWMLAVVGGAIAAAAPVLLDVFDAGATTGVPRDVARDAAWATLGASFGAGLAWMLAGAAHARLIAGRPGRVRTLSRAGQAAVAVLAVAALAIAAGSAGRVSDYVDRQYDAFVHLKDPTATIAPGGEGSRLLTGAGNRYDYWRVAWSGFRERPVLGVGAGNYDRLWFRDRKTVEDVRQPHSLQLQALVELGLVGGALVALLMFGLALGAWRATRGAGGSEVTRAVVVGALGGVTVWLAHTSVDWMHLLPGVTAIALLLAAVLLRARSGPATPVISSPRPVSGRRVAVAVGVAAVVILAGASLSRQGLSERYQRQAFDALPERPADALRAANRSLRLDGEAVRSYYAKAAALARFNEGAAAERTLLEATRKEPRDFVTWALLGDLAVRRDDLAGARRYYGRAATLNPRDPGLRALAANPRVARR